MAGPNDISGAGAEASNNRWKQTQFHQQPTTSESKKPTEQTGENILNPVDTVEWSNNIDPTTLSVRAVTSGIVDPNAVAQKKKKPNDEQSHDEEE